MGEQAASASASGSGSLASCLSMGIAFISKQKRLQPKLSARFLIVQCGPDDSAGYIPLMNCAFLWSVDGGLFSTPAPAWPCRRARGLCVLLCACVAC